MNRFLSGLGMAIDGQLRMAGESPDLRMLTANTLAGLGFAAPMLYSSVDWYTGDTNAVNSGEAPLNLLIGALPVVTTAGGFAAGSMAAPGSKEVGTFEALERRSAKARQQSKSMHDLSRRRPISQERHDRIAQMLDRLSGATNDASAAVIKRAEQLDPALVRPTVERATQRLSTVAGRRAAYGTAIGAVLGGVPAMMMMADSPAQQHQQ